MIYYKPKLSDSNTLTPYILFALISSFGIITFFIFAIIHGSFAFDWLALRNNGIFYGLDYFNHVWFTVEPMDTYNKAIAEWGCFPPFAYIFYRLMFVLTDNGSIPEDYTEIINAPHSKLVFLYYSICVLFLLTFAIEVWRKNNCPYKTLLFCLIFSAPFLGAGFERGNSVMLVLALSLIALKWKDENSKIKKELALILITISFGFKIYPAILGLIYIKEKRFTEAFRLVIYGAITLFVPFIFFGGFEAFDLWLSNIASATLVTHIGRLEYFRGLATTLIYLTTRNENPEIAPAIGHLCLFLLVVLFFISDNKYRSTFYLCCCMTFVPVNAHRYTLSLLAIPLVMYLMEYGHFREKNRYITLTVVEYALLFTIPTFLTLLTDFELSFYFYLFPDIQYLEIYPPHLTIVEVWLYCIAYILVLTVMLQEICSLRKRLNTTIARLRGCTCSVD